MKPKHLRYTLLLPLLLFIGWKAAGNKWITEKFKGYNLVYTSIDKKNSKAYTKLIETGLGTVKVFFDASYTKEFNVVVHPDRHSLDSTWQKDWGMPEFKSECWMVASGVADKLDMISPKAWDKEACEHSYANTLKTQMLITHELVHVYHGQLNVSPDFSTVEGIDWFVEGLATYASGQCDSVRVAEVKKAIADNKEPKQLDDFWTGKLKYGFSGTMVMYVDKTYGRAKLKTLLKFGKKPEILSELNVTEAELLKGWKSFMEKI